MESEKRGQKVELHVFADSDHVRDRMTRRSQTFILVFLNRALILWLSKRQNSVQTSTFGAEFSATSTAVETVQFIRFEVRSFEVEMGKPANTYCNNEAVFKNISKLPCKPIILTKLVFIHHLLNFIQQFWYIFIFT